ncbi:MAG: Glutathionyl-hydroquinone reductase YqjG [Alphaproteobacteria bacterium MarineAlpha2_Bin1]|nr:MAG: Glutathionyl-hydroquinone reductase YqjG [Alphaproteobacteria bacterium MarineAlpha2_Bin1]
MGRLIDGKWYSGDVNTSGSKGNYERVPRTFLDWIAKETKFSPEKNRYHLYVSYACPWAHRTLIMRKLKNLEDFITVSVVSPEMMEDGWKFDNKFSESTIDHLYNCKNLYEIYQKADSNISTTVTVPILWDRKYETIVNNESSQIIRIFNSAFNHLINNDTDFYPKDLRSEIDAINDEIYNNINNGVYKAGFAKNQETYNIAVNNLFESLERVEKNLEGKNFLVGNKMTEADIRFLPTLIRFDTVYYIHFKCSIKKIIEYKNLSRYLNNHFNLDAIKNTTNQLHIKSHYYFSHRMLNPYGIIPQTSFVI